MFLEINIVFFMNLENTIFLLLNILLHVQIIITYYSKLVIKIILFFNIINI